MRTLLLMHSICDVTLAILAAIFLASVLTAWARRNRW